MADDINQNFLDKLFAKYRNSPLVLGTLDILSSPLQDTSDAIDYILDNLSIDEAEGGLLDLMASWIGVTRPPAQETDLFRLYRDEEAADDIDNHHGLAPDDLSSGGYLSGDDGCISKQYPGTYISDEDFRLYVRAKAATFRKRATRDAMFQYILEFGVRAKFTEGRRSIEIEPSSYADMDYSIRYHVVNRGFRPCGIEISIKQQKESDSEV